MYQYNHVYTERMSYYERNYGCQGRQPTWLYVVTA